MIIISPLVKSYLLRKYLSLVLPREAIQRRDSFNFRCNICGDSKKNKFKKRGYFLLHKDRWVFKCHNCGESMNAEKWLKIYYPSHYKQYIIEILQHKQEDERPSTTEKISEKKEYDEESVVTSFVPILKGTTEIFEQAKEFCVKRKIPTDIWEKWYVSTKGKLGGRLIIPFFDNDGKIYHYQARTLCNQEPKYLNRVNNDKIDSIYNKYMIVNTKLIIVQEGPINSMFVENSIATCGLSFADDFVTELEKLGTLWFLFDYDKAGYTKSKQMLEKGKTVFLWKKFASSLSLPPREKWDFNDLILFTGKEKFNIRELKPFFANSNFDSIWL